MALAVVATNAWFSFDEAVSALGQVDAGSYRGIALAAPGLPEIGIPYHHLQRLWLPWGLGMAARGLGITPDALFMAGSIACWVGMLAMLAWLCSRLGLSMLALAVALALAAFNPYLGRYFLAVPFLVADALFVLAVTICGAGVALHRWQLVAWGLVVAAIGRQTALPLALAIWIGWVHLGRPKGGVALLGASAWAVALYWLGGSLGASTGAVNTNVHHITALFEWFHADAPNKAARLAEFFLRMMTGQAAGLSLLLALWWRMRPGLDARVGALILIALSVWAQPVLAGPGISGNNILRLCALAFPALVTLWLVAWARSGQTVFSTAGAVSVVALLFVGSLHHRWSSPGMAWVQTPQRFALLTYGVAVLGGLATYLSIRRVPQPGASTRGG